MNPAALTIRHRTTSFFLTALIALLGVQAYFSVGWLEDPSFSMKVAVVSTEWPGASAEQVEHQIGEPLERAIQELDEVEYIEALSRPSESTIRVHVYEHYRANDLPQIWDQLRNKIDDARPRLPDGARPPRVMDDFGEVSGIVLAVHGDAVSEPELREYARDLQSELLRVPGVARIQFWGERREAVDIALSDARISSLGLDAATVMGAISDRNRMLPDGVVQADNRRLRVQTPGAFTDINTLADTVIADAGTGDHVRLGDIARIERSLLDPPTRMMRFNGQPAVGLAIAHQDGTNVVRMGEALNERLAALEELRPEGIEIGTVAYQPDLVRNAVTSFVRNVAIALVIVLAVMCAFVGVRNGIIVGTGLVLTVLSTLVAMQVFDIDLHRASVGAVIVALGMMVDNAIVTTDLMDVKIRRGISRLRAAAEAVRETGTPLLGATVIGILGFLPILLSEMNTGEYLASLFQVVAISLLASWVVSVTVTPAMGYYLLFRSRSGEPADPHDNPVHRRYRQLLLMALAHRAVFMVGVLVLLVVSVLGFRFVEQSFFPDANRPQATIDYWLPESASIEAVADDLEGIEAWLAERSEVESVTSFIGAGGPRLVMSMEPQMPAANYAQVVINVRRPSDVPSLVAEADEWLAEHRPQAEPRVRPFVMVPGGEFDIEARFVGPDPDVLHGLAAEARRILAADPDAKYVRDNWRQSVPVVRPLLGEFRLRELGLTREEVSAALERAVDGYTVGVLRDGEEQLPIRVRRPAGESAGLDLDALPVWSERRPHAEPLGSLVHALEIDWEPGRIWRRDRQRTITVQADSGYVPAYEIRGRVVDAIEGIDLPSGYRMEWGGEYEENLRGQSGVISKVPIAVLLMVVITVVLFNSLRHAAMIFLTIPLAIVGVITALLLTAQPFSFMALLGIISLSGMIIKNGIVLLDQTRHNIEAGMVVYPALVEASVSRLSPIAMAALTTALGMTPILFDTLFRTMAITIFGGLLFATLLTLLVLPVLYTAFYRLGHGEE